MTASSGKSGAFFSKRSGRKRSEADRVIYYLIRCTVRAGVDRLEEVLSAVLNRRPERSDRRREHIAELNKRAAETELRLKRLYDRERGC